MAQNATANANVNITTNTSQAEAQITQLEGSIRVLDGAVNLVGGGLETLAGGLAITGALSKEQAEQFEGLAVGAIAFADGAKRTLDGVVNLQEGFTKLAASSKFAATASRLLGTAIRFATGPVGIAIAAIGALIGILVTFKDSLGVVGDVINNIIGAFTRLTDAIGLTNSAQDAAIAKSKEAVKQGEFELEALKAAGATREQLVAKERQLLKDKIAAEKAGSDEQKKAVQDLFLFNEKTRTENRTAEKKDADERAKKAKEAADKRLADAKTADELYKSQLEKFADEEVNLLAKTDEEKLKIDFDRNIREINDLKLSEERKTQLRLEAEQNYNIKLNDLRDTQAKENQEKEDERLKAAEETNLSRLLEAQALAATTLQEKRDADLAALQSQYDKEYALAKENGEDLDKLDALYNERRKKLNDDTNKAIEEQDKAAAQFKAQIINETVDNFQGALTALFGESKAVASANVLIDAAQASVGIIASSQKFKDPTGTLAIIYQISQFALLAATTTAALRQINSAQPGSGGGTGGTPKPTPIGGGAFTGALPGTGGGVPTSGTPATGTPQGGSGPIRAYVVTQDVSNGQEAAAAINRRRRLGPG
jgi:hypothetical protein